MDELIEHGMGCFLWLVIAAALLGLTSVIGDCYYSRRSFAAQAACEQQRMEVRRRFWDTAVVCVPVKTRQDTTTVNVNAK